MNELSDNLLIPPGTQDLVRELFHENSKITRYSEAPSAHEIRKCMKEFHDTLPFEGYPVYTLPAELSTLSIELQEAIVNRTSTREFVPHQISSEELGTLLFYAYGNNRDNKDTEFIRPFRVVPSGGALYPLEIFFYSSHLKDLPMGVFHYNPQHNHIRLIHKGNHNETLSRSLISPEIGLCASLIIFITAMFERSSFKYGDRSYRFILLEAGHVAQNLNLIATGLGLGVLNIGGFYDREIDDFLGLDGVTHSTIYMLAIGEKEKI